MRCETDGYSVLLVGLFGVFGVLSWKLKWHTVNTLLVLNAFGNKEANTRMVGFMSVAIVIMAVIYTLGRLW